MAIKFNRSQTFATNGTVTAPALHNLVDGLDIYQALITDQTNLTSVGTADELLIADADLTPNDAPRAVTVQELFSDALTIGTYTDANFTGNLTYGTATGNRTVSTNASITTGTINNATLGTTIGTAATFTSSTLGTTTATAATITSGTITTGLIPTLTAGTTTGTAGIFTSGTVATLNSTTGTIGNLSTTLAGDFTISQGTATLATSGATAGTYGSVTEIPFLTVDAKGRITSATTGTFSSTPADGSITPAKLSQPFTLGTAVTATSGTAIDFTGIPSWTKRIILIMNGFSTNGSSGYLVRLGTSLGVESTGYNSISVFAGTATGGASSTSGFLLDSGGSANLTYGHVTITKISGNIWVSSVSAGLAAAGGNFVWLGGGNISLSSNLDRLRLTTVNGTDTFDAGSINIMYE